MSVIEAKINEGLTTVSHHAREKHYPAAVSELTTLLSMMDRWYRSEPQVHRIYFRSYYRAIKATLYGDLGLYRWLCEEYPEAYASWEKSLHLLPTHMTLQRLSYLSVVNDASEDAVKYLLLMVSDPVLNYDKFTFFSGPSATHPSEALALRAATVAYYGNVVEGINLITLALAYHSQASSDIVTPLVCHQLREGIPPRIIKRIPEPYDMTPLEKRKYTLLLRIFVSLCKVAVNKCLKLPIVLNCDIRNVLQHVLGNVHKLVVSNVIFDPMGLCQTLLDKYIAIGGDVTAVRVDINNKEYLIDFFTVAFPCLLDTRLTTRSFTAMMREHCFSDTIWRLLSTFNKQASRRAAEMGMRSLSQSKIVEEMALAEYIYNVHRIRLAPFLSDQPKAKEHIDLMNVPGISIGDAVTSVVNGPTVEFPPVPTVQTTVASELAVNALTQHTRSTSVDSFDSCVLETKESLMQAFQEALQARKTPSSTRHIVVQKSHSPSHIAPIRSLEVSDTHLCASSTELAELAAETAVGRSVTPLDTLWTKCVSTCEECRDPKPTYQPRRITTEAGLEACIEGYKQNQRELMEGGPYYMGLTGLYNSEVERIRNTSALTRFMLGSTIHAVQESGGSPIKPFSAKCRRIAKTLHTNDQDYLLDTLPDKLSTLPISTHPDDLSKADLVSLKPVHGDRVALSDKESKMSIAMRVRSIPQMKSVNIAKYVPKARAKSKDKSKSRDKSRARSRGSGKDERKSDEKCDTDRKIGPITECVMDSPLHIVKETIPLPVTKSPRRSVTRPKQHAKAHDVPSLRTPQSTDGFVAPRTSTTAAPKTSPPITKISTKVVPKSNVLAEKITLECAAVKEPQQAESVYANVGLITAILQKPGSAAVGKQHDVEKQTIESGVPDSIFSARAPKAPGAGHPTYTDILTYHAPFNDCGAADDSEVFVSTMLPEPAKVDLFQHCQAEQTSPLDSPNDDSLTLTTHSQRLLDNSLNPASMLCMYKERAYNQALHTYLVEDLPQETNNHGPTLIVNHKPASEVPTVKRQHYKVVELPAATAKECGSLHVMSGKVISALLAYQ